MQHTVSLCMCMFGRVRNVSYVRDNADLYGFARLDSDKFYIQKKQQYVYSTYVHLYAGLGSQERLGACFHV